MNGWLILLLVLVILFLVSRLRLGAQVHYDKQGLILRVIAGPARVQVLPRREKPAKAGKKPKQKKEKRRAKPGKAKPAPSGDQPSTVKRVLDLLPVVAKAAGALRRKILIRRLELSVIWGGADAAEVALGYGRAWALVGMIWPLFDHNFHVRHHAFHIDADYQADRPELSLELELTMTLGQVLAFALHYGGMALSRWSRSGRKSRQRQGGTINERTKSSDQ